MVRNTFPPNDSTVDQISCHVKDVFDNIPLNFLGATAVIPTKQVYIIKGLIDGTFFTPHVPKLVHYHNHEDPVILGMRLSHGGKLINLNYEPRSEAVVIKHDAVVVVHSSLDAQEEVM